MNEELANRIKANPKYQELVSKRTSFALKLGIFVLALFYSYILVIAFNKEFCFHKEAFKILADYYPKGEFNEGRKKMAKIPQNAKLIYNPSSGAPGFIVKNVFCLPGVPSILESMVEGLRNKIVGGKKILSKTISVNTVESEIARSLEIVQHKFKNIEIGSYPFFRLGKVGVSIVMRSTEMKNINECSKQILSFIQRKKIQIIKRD